MALGSCAMRKSARESKQSDTACTQEQGRVPCFRHTANDHADGKLDRGVRATGAKRRARAVHRPKLIAEPVTVRLTAAFGELHPADKRAPTVYPNQPSRCPSCRPPKWSELLWRIPRGRL